MLCLNVEAPFAVFRSFFTGHFRPTAGFMTFSAAYGLLLNIAGIEMRKKDEKSGTTLIKHDSLPSLSLAIGALELPVLQSLLQQLHNYPVGSSGKEHAPQTKGTKYNIKPVQRSFLYRFKACICVKGDRDFENRIYMGINGEIPRLYGLPFLGDNNFLIDKLEVVEKQKKALWFEIIDGEDDKLRENATRMTITIDRTDISKTKSALFAPVLEKTTEIPEKAWVKVSY